MGSPMIRSHFKTYFRVAIPAFGLHLCDLLLTYPNGVCSPQITSIRHKIRNFTSESGFEVTSRKKLCPIAGILFFMILLQFSFLGDLRSDDSKITVPKKEPQFVLKDSIWRTQAQEIEYYDFVKSQGYTAVDLEVMDHKKFFYFHSSDLTKNRWKFKSDLLTPFLSNWNSMIKKSDENRELFLDFSHYSQCLNGVEGFGRNCAQNSSPERSKSFMMNLYENYDFKGIISESFPKDLQSFLFWSSIVNKKKMTLFLPMKNWEQLTRTFMDKEEIKRSVHRIIFSGFTPYPISYKDLGLPTVGVGDLFMALSRMANREIWIGSSIDSPLSAGLMHNYILYRTAQFLPDGFMMIPSEEDSYLYDSNRFNFEQDFKKDILEFYGTQFKNYKKPVVNIVFTSYKTSKISLDQIIEPITNAFLANGYELKVTFDELIPKADAYYLIVGEKGFDNYLFCNELLALMNSKKSHFYNPIIIHPLGEISNSGSWKRIREIFKIPSTEKGWISEIPYQASLAGHKAQWKASVESEKMGMTYIQEPRVRQVGGDIFVSELLQNQTLALILKSDNCYLINSNMLHLEASYFISQIIGGALQKPVLGYVSSDRNYTAVFALADTNIKIKIPTPEPPKEWKLILFNKDGKRIRDEIIPGKDIFEIPLKSYELFVLLSNKQN